MNAYLMGEALPLIDYELARMREQTINKATQALASGQLTPAAALALWQEVWAIEKLGARLKSKAKVGVAESADLTQILPIG